MLSDSRGAPLRFSGTGMAACSRDEGAAERKMKSIEKRTSSAIIVVFSPAQILKRKEAKSGVSIFGPKKKKGGKKACRESDSRRLQERLHRPVSPLSGLRLKQQHPRCRSSFAPVRHMMRIRAVKERKLPRRGGGAIGDGGCC